MARSSLCREASRWAAFTSAGLAFSNHANSWSMISRYASWAGESFSVVVSFVETVAAITLSVAPAGVLACTATKAMVTSVAIFF